MYGPLLLGLLWMAPNHAAAFWASWHNPKGASCLHCHICLKSWHFLAWEIWFVVSQQLLFFDLTHKTRLWRPGGAPCRSGYNGQKAPETGDHTYNLWYIYFFFFCLAVCHPTVPYITILVAVRLFGSLAETIKLLLKLQRCPSWTSVAELQIWRHHSSPDQKHLRY